jgi:hypothetical protein
MFMKATWNLALGLTTSAILAGGSGTAWAESFVEAGNVEVYGSGLFNGGLPSLGPDLRSALGGYGFGSVGIEESPMKWGAGGGVGYALLPNLMVVGDFTYSRLAQLDVSVQPNPLSSPLTIRETAKTYEFTGGIQYLMARTSRAVPFLGAAFGVAHAAVSAQGSDVSGANANVSIDVGNYRMAKLTGGVRIYISRSFGIRPEFNIVRLPGETFYRASFGAFFQFH